MHIPAVLQSRFTDALAPLTDDAAKYAEMIRGTTDPKFGDYQANCAMPLAKQSDGKNPREIAADLVARLVVDDICDAPEIAGPGFINLKLKDAFLLDRVSEMLSDTRCLVPAAMEPGRIVIDFSSPNVAKPMHVGHIRSTVIGDSLSRILRFLGHTVTTDNHLGDWGTQFGMIIYGYKHFGDPEVVAANPVPELASLYRQVHQLIEYPKQQEKATGLLERIADLEQQLDDAQREQQEASDPKEQSKAKKAAATTTRRLVGAREDLESAQAAIQAVDTSPVLRQRVLEHSGIEQATLQETAKLHEGDQENIQLWEQFLPHCKDEINRIYSRLNVEFDHTLGESFYHPMLANVVQELEERGLAKESDGAICVFLPDFDAPMIVRKKDGAFLYSTTDLATLKYRQSEFDPTEILYVVDARQSEHFQKLFDVAKLVDMGDVKFAHVKFGTVLGEDGKPIKTRSGTSVGLESLLDDAVAGARKVVCDPERLKTVDPPMDQDEQNRIAEVVGIGAIKYADLSHYRTSDYKFNLEKMVALEGKTSTYVQYSYARTRGILRTNDVTEDDVMGRVGRDGLQLTHPAERSLALMLLKLEEALLATYQDYAPNHLVDYLYETAKAFAVFNQQCHVLHAENVAVQTTRLALVTLSGRVLKLGLDLLGIEVVDRM